MLLCEMIRFPLRIEVCTPILQLIRLDFLFVINHHFQLLLKTLLLLSGTLQGHPFLQKPFPLLFLSLLVGDEGTHIISERLLQMIRIFCGLLDMLVKL